MRVDVKEIIQLLEEPTENRIPIKWKVLQEAPLEELITAMHEPKMQITYRILCELLGKRRDAQAVPVLIETLHDADASVRAEAAQALALIENPLAGEAVMAQYLAEEDQGTKEWYVIALGAVGYCPAVPYLIQALNVENLRRYAALALSELKAKEAKGAIAHALARETEPYTVKLIQQVLTKLDEE